MLFIRVAIYSILTTTHVTRFVVKESRKEIILCILSIN